MHQLERRGVGAGGGQLLAHEVLDRLDVVIDAPLDGLDALGGVGCRDRAPARRRAARTAAGSAACSSCSRGAVELREPQRLDADALADQRGFGKVIAQRRRRGGVAAIHGRERGQS